MTPASEWALIGAASGKLGALDDPLLNQPNSPVRITKTTMKTKFLLTCAALSISASAGAVGTLQITSFTFDPFAGGNPSNLYDPANAITQNSVVAAPLAPPPPTGLYPGAGQMTGLLNGASFVAYCVEISTLVGFSTVHTNYVPVDGVTGFGAAKAADLAKLITWASGAGMPSNAYESAAIQSAVWEIVHETGLSYSFSADQIKATSANPLMVAALNAIPWATIAATTPTYTVSRLDSPTTQDMLVFTTAVPETGRAVMFGLGLLGLGMVSRRRARQ
jgi:hypothetical protein